MYHPRFTQQRLEGHADRLNAVARDKGLAEWTPIYHSLPQIQHAIGHLDDLWDPEQKRLKRALNQDERDFITNERRICRLDFRGYWLINYAWIVDWRQNPVRFKPNVAQNIVMDVWAAREVEELAIWMLQLKARRLGVSTLTELAVQHRFQFHPHSNCVVASADPTKSNEMAGMIKFSLERQPFWLLPQGKPKIQNMMPVEYPDIDTSLTIQAGNQFTGVARGATPNVIHVSEMASWPDAREQIDGSLMRAVIDGPKTFGIMESTAWGTGNWLHETWELAKAEHPEGRSRLVPMFLPWFVGTDLYPSAANLKARPIPANWVPSDRVVQHAERAREYVLLNPLLFEHLAQGNRDWKMPREQMWYNEIEYNTARKKKELNIFLSEMPADDMEAFQSPNLPIIDPEILIGYQERTRHPIAVYTIIGPEIPSSLVVPRRYWDADQPPITLNTREVTPKFDEKYQLVPVKFQGYPSFDPELKLLIWEYPDPHETYGIGVDTSEGLGLDRAVIEVLREATPRAGPGQVAEWASAYVTAFQLWPLVLAVATLYSHIRVSATKKKQSRLAIEAFANGAACQHELQKRGWSNFHAWKSYDNRKNRKDSEVNKLGVYTNATFRAQMFDMLLTNLTEEAIDLPSPYLVQELTRLERRDGKRKTEASYGAHDDRIMAIGFPLFSLHMGKDPRQQHARKRVNYAPGLDRSEQARRYPVWQPDNQSHDLGDPMLYRPQRGGIRQQVQLIRPVNAQMPKGYR